jgi:hypothetical protein
MAKPRKHSGKPKPATNVPGLRETASEVQLPPTEACPINQHKQLAGMT